MIIGDLIRLNNTDFYIDDLYEIIDIISEHLISDIIIVDRVIKHKKSPEYMGEHNMIDEYNCHLDIVEMRKRKLKKLLK